MKIHIKGDVRILGNGDFVEKILSRASEQSNRRYRLKAKGWKREDNGVRSSFLTELLIKSYKARYNISFI